LPRALPLVNKTEDEEDEERDQYKVSVVVVTQKPNTKAALLREFLYVVIAEEQGIFVREHREFSHPNRLLLSSDAVHGNAQDCTVCTGAIVRLS
jgi:hypothetical protein